MTNVRHDSDRRRGSWRRQGAKTALVALAIAASAAVGVSGVLAQADDPALAEDAEAPEVFRWPVDILGEDFLEEVFGDEFPAPSVDGGDFNVGGSTGGMITIGGGSGGISIGGGSSGSDTDD